MNSIIHFIIIVVLTWSASLNAQDVRPFRIEVEDEVLQDLQTTIRFNSGIRFNEFVPSAETVGSSSNGDSIESGRRGWIMAS